ncbi:LYAM3 protein, partial [Polypterus senegalus]
MTCVALAITRLRCQQDERTGEENIAEAARGQPSWAAVAPRILIGHAGTWSLEQTCWVLWGLLGELQSPIMDFHHTWECFPELVEGWTYHYSNKTMKWNEAREWCKTHYTDMVAIQNKGEIAYLNEILPYVKGYYWIGIRKMKGNWTWVGTKKTLTKEAENWADNEPNNGRNNEDCVEIYIKRKIDEGKWNDEDCNKRKTALCYTVNQCSELTSPLNGRMNCTHPIGGFSFGTACSFDCAKGYKLKGSGRVSCSADGTWSSEQPECEAITCSPLKEPQNSLMKCDTPNGNFSYNTSCQFSCVDGFYIKGATEITCTESGEWRDSIPQCEAIKCGSLQTIDNGFINCSNPDEHLVYNSTCQFSCGEGFVLEGASHLQCTASGQWSGETPACKVNQCSELTSPLNGEMACTHPIGSFSFGTACSFECGKGYRLKGSEKISCSAEGTWSSEQPKCEAIKCGSLQTIDNGFINCSNPDEHLLYNLTCQFSCGEGFVLEGASHLQCTASGQWSANIPQCKAIKCGSLQTIDNGFINCSNPDEELVYNSTCQFSCEEGFVLEGASHLQCTASGQWSGETPACKDLHLPPASIQDTATVCLAVVPAILSSGLMFAAWLMKRLRQKGCCEGWKYFYSEDTMDYDHARKWCTENYTDMVAIQNQEEIEYLNKVIPRMKVYYWIGLRKIDGIWTWVGTKKPLVKEAENWASREPNNQKLGEDCVEIYIKRDTDQGKWNDELCTKKKHALCYRVSTCTSQTTLAHGRMNCSHPFGNFSYNSSCNFDCNEGFIRKGAKTLRCTEFGEWSGQTPACQVSECTSLTTPNHGSMKCSHPFGNFSYSSSCDFACNKGFIRKGNGTVHCTESGKWSNLQPECQAQSEISPVKFMTLSVIGGTAATLVCSSVTLLLLMIYRKSRSLPDITSNNAAYGHKPTFAGPDRSGKKCSPLMSHGFVSPGVMDGFVFIVEGIEHVRDLLDRRVRARAIPPRNVQELAGALVEEWGNISQQELTNLVQSMRRRCTAVLQAAGGHSRY